MSYISPWYREFTLKLVHSGHHPSSQVAQPFQFPSSIFFPPSPPFLPSLLSYALRAAHSPRHPGHACAHACPALRRPRTRAPQLPADPTRGTRMRTPLPARAPPGQSTRRGAHRSQLDTGPPRRLPTRRARALCATRVLRDPDTAVSLACLDTRALRPPTSRATCGAPPSPLTAPVLAQHPRAPRACSAWRVARPLPEL